MTKLSIIVPCFNEALALPIYFDEMSKIEKNLGVEIEYILVNDGSNDNTLEVMLKLKNSYNNIHIFNFSRNFGKEAALLAGLKNSTGDFVVTMDVDLQDPPSLLPEMLATLKLGNYDSVSTYRVNRDGEPRIRSFFARQFYKLINKMSEIEIVDGARDYRMMSRKMVDAVLSLSEYHRFSKGIFVWVGFKTKYISFENVKRSAGETKWSFWKLLLYAIEGVVAFTTAPLRLSMLFGFITSAMAFFYMIFVMIKALLYGDPVAGYPSMMVIILFLGGIQLLGIGVLGEYLSKTYMEVKHRPNYIIKDIL